jgi:GntR family transcriptional regulator
MKSFPHIMSVILPHEELLQEMERQGWVHRIRGKGTFVREGKVRRSASRILSFTKNMLEEGRTPSTKLISIHLLKPTRSITINNRKHILKGSGL